MGGPPNNGQNVGVEKTPYGQLGGNSTTAVTQLPNLVSVGQISPPQADFIRPTPPAKDALNMRRN